MWICRCCEEEFKSETRCVYTHRNHKICMDCCHEYYFTCDECGDVFHQDDMCGGGSCAGCHDSRWIHDSGYTPYPLTFNALPGEVTKEYFGFELETETGDLDLAEFVTDKLIYCKEDCSVDGFEMVTHPMTRKYFYNHLKEGGFDKMFSLSTKGCKSYNSRGSSGLHIHMSKDSFSKLTIYKMFKLIYTSANAAFWKAISRRRNGNVGEYASINMEGRAKFSNLAKEGYGFGKFSALNVTHMTIELRIFRGTLNREGFVGDIELYLAFKDYAKQSSISNLSIENFMKFVMVNKSTYPYLISLLDKVYTQKEYLEAGFVGVKAAHVTETSVTT